MIDLNHLIANQHIVWLHSFPQKYIYPVSLCVHLCGTSGMGFLQQQKTSDVPFPVSTMGKHFLIVMEHTSSR